MRLIQTVPDFGENILVQPKFSELAGNWKSVVSSVLAIALLMSGFFWLGYWTAEQNHRSESPSALAAPSPQSPQARQKPQDSQPDKSEKTEGEENSFNDGARWVNL